MSVKKCINSGQVKSFQFTDDYHKAYRREFAKLRRLARMHNRLIVKMAKAAQKRGV